MIGRDEVAAWNVPSGIVFDMLREAAAHRPGVLTKVGMETFVDPDQDGCAMNDAARAAPIVRRVEFDGEDWLYFPAIAPDVAIIRATTADENGNLSYEHEGAYLGAMEMALAARNRGGVVIAQVKRIAKSGTLRPHDVHVPGILVDVIVEAPDQMQTTATEYDPAISGEVFRPLSSFEAPEFGVGKAIARRVAMELRRGWAVNIGFGVSANVPRILMEEGLHGAVTWVIEQGAVGGVPLLGFQFGCAANAEAFVASPHQFCYFQGGGFDASLLSFLEIGRDGSVNVSRLAATPHRTAGAGGFVDITARAKRIVFSGNFNAGAKMSLVDGRLRIDREGSIAKVVEAVDQVSFSGRRAVAQGQDVTYVTERCVMRLTSEGLVVTEIAPGLDLQRDVLDQAAAPLGRGGGSQGDGRAAVPAGGDGLGASGMMRSARAAGGRGGGGADHARPAGEAERAGRGDGGGAGVGLRGGRAVRGAGLRDHRRGRAARSARAATSRPGAARARRRSGGGGSATGTTRSTRSPGCGSR